jgi:uncharacterized protein (DUF305 family)
MLLAGMVLLGGCSAHESEERPTADRAGTATVTAAATGTAATATATGTGAGTGTNGSAGKRHSTGDVAFVRALLPHHQAGITLARAVATRPQARELAEAIIATQQDEIVRMTAWLTEWGETPASNPAASKAAGSGAGGDPIASLIAHQEEAVRIAQDEQAAGTNPAALAFARQVVESRTGEVAQLREYAGLPSATPTA